MPTTPYQGVHPAEKYPMVATAAETLRKIEAGEILGASRSIRLINEALCQHADAFDGDSGMELARSVRAWTDFIRATRGALSPAVGNSIDLVFRDFEISAQDADVREVRALLHRRVDNFNQASLDKVEAISRIGANMLEDGQRVMAYDYSSSVTAVLAQASEDGKRLDVVIPESRSLDGGRPILQEVLETKHTATFTVDAAIGEELKTCAALLVGAESLTADGGFWNTVGTCSAAILARHYNAMVLVPTELIKYDRRSDHGDYRKVVKRPLTVFDLDDLAPASSRLKIACDDLEFTPRHLVSAYITELGPLPPGEIRSAFHRVFSSD